MSVTTQPAPPLLGSNLLAAARAHESTRPTPASSGCAALDEAALSGGFRYGEITSIAGASGTGKTLVGLNDIIVWGLRIPFLLYIDAILVCLPTRIRLSFANVDGWMIPNLYQLVYHIVASHLLASPLGEVAFIDSLGSFSPVRLRDVLVFRLQAKYHRESYQQSGYMYERSQPDTEEAKQDSVHNATTMLDRVKVMRVFDFAGMVEAVGELGEMREPVPSVVENAAGKTRKEIDDSEEEPDQDEDSPTEQVSKGAGQVGLIVVDSIANVVGSLMAKSQTQGQALLASFMRSLQFFTSRNHICTVLTNAVVGVTASSNQEYKRRLDDNVSIFSSTPGKPALGKTFTYLIDTSILLSTIPKTANDAASGYGNRGDASTFKKAFVLEVLKDRCGSREGRWAAFEISDEVKIIPCYS